MFKQGISILGTQYVIIEKKYKDDEYFERNDAAGYCDKHLKEIGLCDLFTFPGLEHETDEHIITMQKEILRHEIVHAFLFESGLDSSTMSIDNSWATCEEIVDWIAIQGPKIHAAWVSVGAI